MGTELHKKKLQSKKDISCYKNGGKNSGLKISRKSKKKVCWKNWKEKMLNKFKGEIAEKNLKEKSWKN